MTTNTGGPAFPSKQKALLIEKEHAHIAKEIEIDQNGMSLRDYFAAKAMQTIISYRRTQFGTGSDEMDWDEYFPIIAQEAYALADAMLEARKA